MPKFPNGVGTVEVESSEVYRAQFMPKGFLARILHYDTANTLRTIYPDNHMVVSLETNDGNVSRKIVPKSGVDSFPKLQKYLIKQCGLNDTQKKLVETVW